MTYIIPTALPDGRTVTHSRSKVIDHYCTSVAEAVSNLPFLQKIIRQEAKKGHN